MRAMTDPDIVPAPIQILRRPARQTIGDIVNAYRDVVVALRPLPGESDQSLAANVGLGVATYRRAMRGLHVRPTHLRLAVEGRGLAPARIAEIYIRETEAVLEVRLPQSSYLLGREDLKIDELVDFRASTLALLGTRTCRAVAEASSNLADRSIRKSVVGLVRAGAVPRPGTARALLFGVGATQEAGYRWLVAYGCARHPSLRPLLDEIGGWVHPDRYPATARWLQYIHQRRLPREDPADAPGPLEEAGDRRGRRRRRRAN